MCGKSCTFSVVFIKKMNTTHSINFFTIFAHLIRWHILAYSNNELFG